MINRASFFNQKRVMAIVNCTPDSFYDKSRLNATDDILAVCKQHIDNGATILDLGGYSSRPGAVEVSIQEELDRVLPVIEQIRTVFPSIVLSIDTFRKDVAEKAVKAGVNIVNDISGGLLDEGMLPFIAENKIPYILMHMRGTPQNMHEKCNYVDLVKDIVTEVRPKIDFLKQQNVDVIFDPGFGFAKNEAQNYELLSRLEEFNTLDCPILVGVSRKSMIYKFLEIGSSEALNGTTIINTIALQKGASILRVHDAKEASEAIKIVEKTSLF
jgi:dihydropteroate synthase